MKLEADFVLFPQPVPCSGSGSTADFAEELNGLVDSTRQAPKYLMGRKRVKEEDMEKGTG
jgi:hypothetical protein